MKRYLLRVTFTCFLLVASAVPAASQASQTNTPINTSQATPSDSVPRKGIDKTFELDIKEQRISESDFKASTSVETSQKGMRSFKLSVGAEVGASNIDVLLQEVHGQVRFYTTQEQILPGVKLHYTTDGEE